MALAPDVSGIGLFPSVQSEFIISHLSAWPFGVFNALKQLELDAIVPAAFKFRLTIGQGDHFGETRHHFSHTTFR